MKQLPKVLKPGTDISISLQSLGRIWFLRVILVDSTAKPDDFR
jgi:hypothetical protein